MPQAVDVLKRILETKDAGYYSNLGGWHTKDCASTENWRTPAPCDCVFGEGRSLVKDSDHIPE